MGFCKLQCCLVLRSCHSHPSLQQPPPWSVSSSKVWNISSKILLASRQRPVWRCDPPHGAVCDGRVKTGGHKGAFERRWTQSKGQIAKEEDEDGNKKKLEIVNETASGGNHFKTAVVQRDVCEIDLIPDESLRRKETVGQAWWRNVTSLIEMRVVNTEDEPLWDRRSSCLDNAWTWITRLNQGGLA